MKWEDGHFDYKVKPIKREVDAIYDSRGLVLILTHQSSNESISPLIGSKKIHQFSSKENSG